MTQVDRLTIANPIANEIASIQFAIIDTSKEVFPIDPAESATYFSASLDRHVGLGLMLVQPLIALHGGDFSCQSIGKGNCFKVSLPHNLDNFDITMDGSSYYPNSTEDQPVNFDDTIAEVSASLSPLILIVDDNILNVNTIESYLTAKGYRSIVANDGQTAIELTQKYQPDLILMDIQMPGMDGLEAISKIRHNTQLGAIPIIALTALAMDGDRQICLRAGANDYLTKPVKLKQLHTTIQQLLVAKSDPVDVDVTSDLWA